MYDGRTRKRKLEKDIIYHRSSLKKAEEDLKNINIEKEDKDLKNKTDCSRNKIYGYVIYACSAARFKLLTKKKHKILGDIYIDGAGELYSSRINDALYTDFGIICGVRKSYFTKSNIELKLSQEEFDNLKLLRKNSRKMFNALIKSYFKDA